MEATRVMERVRGTAAAAKSNRTRSPSMDIGDFVRQGDLYLYRVELPGDVEPIAAVKQLAPGNTQGSRHELDSLDGVTMHRLRDANPLQGPILTLREQRTLTHPEHGHITLQPGCYAVTYQRTHADEVRAVQD